MSMLLILVAVFGGTVLLVVAGYQLVNRRRLETADMIQSRLMGARLDTGAQVPVVSILKEQRASSFAFLDRLLSGRATTATLALKLEAAGSRRTPGEFVLVSALCAFLGWFVLGKVSPLAALVGAALLGSLPLLNLKRLIGKRLRAFEMQLPDAIDMLVNAMKAGYSFQAAMKFIGDEMPEPLGPEFMRYYDEQRLGVDARTALLHLQERVSSLDLRMFVTAMLIQRESGGNLAEVMTKLSSLMRDRVALRGEIATLTAEPRASAVVLTALPIVIAAGLTIMNPDYMRPMFVTPIGKTLAIMCAVSITIGYMILRKIGNIDV